MEVGQKIKIETPYDPVTPLLGTYPKKTKTLIQKDICTPMFTAALFRITKISKQPKCPTINEWTKKMGYTYKGILFGHKKRIRSCHLQQHGWN